ncbi:MAG TPA: hypothetical protein VG297_26140 [Bryobacteraceae bacterium]|jgi:hypothetical protein|nr:hypothetical protein [Bryobacteraceae bacterium]
MKRIFKSLALTFIATGFASFAAAATMEGTISDSMCGTSHAKMMEMHKDAKMTDRDCTLACVKNGGKFVFVSDGKVYNVANQNFAALTQRAGEPVSLTGTVQGDTITVSKISAKK